ncbi:MAG: hypothetical protein WDN69_24890 [Aliidongia sp.]
MLAFFGEILFSRMGHWCDGELQQRTKKLLADAKRQVGEANKAAGEANERAAKAVESAERLKAVAAWRSLTNDEIGAVKLSLDGSGAPASIRLVLMANDPESLYFAQQFSIPFKAAGWNVGLRFEVIYRRYNDRHISSRERR